MTPILLEIAEADLEDIGRFTVARWGADQAADYLRDLLQVIEAIGDGGRSPSFRKVSGTDLRRYRAGSHFVFARVNADEVTIVRVLHERMNHEAHLLA